MINQDGGFMNKEQIAEQIASELLPEEWKQSGSFRVDQNRVGRDIATAAALRALEYGEKRIAELEAELTRANDLLIEIGEYDD